MNGRYRRQHGYRSSAECISFCPLFLGAFPCASQAGRRPGAIFDIAEDNFFSGNPAALLSILGLVNRLSHGGTQMTASAMVLDVSEDWAIACDVQQRFMQAPKRATDAGMSYSAYCRQSRAVGG